MKFSDSKKIFLAIRDHLRDKRAAKIDVSVRMNALSEKRCKESLSALKELVSEKEERKELIEIYGSLPLQHLGSRGGEAFWKAYRKIHPPVVASNESDIREAVVEFIDKKYKNYTIRHEFTQTDLSVRTDILAISNVADVKAPLIAVEIKSDRDSFERIYRQLSEYELFSTTIWIALDQKHLHTYLNKYGSRFSSVGILVYADGELSEHKRALHREMPFLLNLLWAKELLHFIELFKGRSKVSRASKDLLKIIKSIYTYREIQDISAAIFMDRMQRGDVGMVEFGEYVDLSLKQELFSELLDEKYWKTPSTLHIQGRFPR